VSERDAHGGEGFHQKQDIIGYLCIDTNSRNVFRERYDMHLGGIVADALFIFLKNYYDFLVLKGGTNERRKG